ncbi:MAG: DUF4249 domain-containing protein [Cyclobacteriaceae bacterium]
MKALRFILIFAVFFGVVSCEKEIFPDLNQPFELVVIDAWLTDKPGPQQIFITRSQPYFENEFPEKVEGAIVQVISSDSVVYNFSENDSAYTWTAADSCSFVEVGQSYFLFVEVDGQQHSAFTTVGVVPEIDSVRYNFEEAIPNFIPEDHYLAEFYARDPEGLGNAYWIRGWKNGEPLSKPSEISIAFDAGGSPGAAVDGVQFIQPIRQSLNPFDQEEAGNLFNPPYLLGDSVYIEIHSISAEAFFFLTEVATQTNRAGGFAALFAQPVANVSSNIFNLDQNSTTKAVGYFNVAAVSSAGLRLSLAEAEDARDRFETRP